MKNYYCYIVIVPWMKLTLFTKVIDYLGGALGVIVIVVGNGHGDTSSNPGRDWLHFT